MSSSLQTPAIARIPGSQSFVNDRAPIKLGRKRGYFKDKETKSLLSLNKGNFLSPMACMATRSLPTNQSTSLSYGKGLTTTVSCPSYPSGEVPYD
jgi:hypothetical protein